MEIWQFVVALLGLIATILIAMICGFWTISQSLDKRFETMDLKNSESFKTVFRRMDERFEKTEDTFVNKNIYEENRKNLDRELDLRLTAMMQILTEKFSTAERYIGEIRQFIKDNFTNHAK